MSLYDDLTSGDGHRIMSAVWDIHATRDPEQLEPLAREIATLERATGDVDLGGALVANSGHVEHALERLRLVRAGECLCGAYLDGIFYDPEREQVRGHVRIVETIPTFYKGQPDRPERVCECVDCGRRFSVEEGEYHYPWWKWTAEGKPARRQKKKRR